MSLDALQTGESAIGYLLVSTESAPFTVAILGSGLVPAPASCGVRPGYCSTGQQRPRLKFRTPRELLAIHLLDKLLGIGLTHAIVHKFFSTYLRRFAVVNAFRLSSTLGSVVPSSGFSTGCSFCFFPPAFLRWLRLQRFWHRLQ